MSAWPTFCGPIEFPHVLNIINVCLCVIYLIIYSVSGVHGLRQLCGKEHAISNKYRYIFVVSLLCGVTSSIAYLLTIISCYAGSPLTALILVVFTSVPSHVLWAAIWFNLLLRLEGAFNQSVYAMNHKLMLLFKAIGVVMFMLGMAQLFLWISGLHTVYFGNVAKGNELNSYDTWLLNSSFGVAAIIILSEMAIFLVFGLTFGALFISRILRLVRHEINTLYLSHGNVNSTKQVSLDAEHTKLIHVVSRTVVLSFFAILSTFLIFVVIIYRSGNEQDEQYAYPITTLLQLLDMAINFVCIHLNYAFAKTQYKTICRCCDRCVLRVIKHKSAVDTKRMLHIAASSSAVEVTLESPRSQTSISNVNRH